eukprot:gene9515-biopygen12227
MRCHRPSHRKAPLDPSGPRPTIAHDDEEGQGANRQLPLARRRDPPRTIVSALPKQSCVRGRRGVHRLANRTQVLLRKPEQLERPTNDNDSPPPKQTSCDDLHGSVATTCIAACVTKLHCLVIALLCMLLYVLPGIRSHRRTKDDGKRKSKYVVTRLASKACTGWGVRLIAILSGVPGCLGWPVMRALSGVPGCLGWPAKRAQSVMSG